MIFCPFGRLHPDMCTHGQPQYFWSIAMFSGECVQFTPLAEIAMVSAVLLQHVTVVLLSYLLPGAQHNFIAVTLL